jgi:hypothetical protein
MFECEPIAIVTETVAYHETSAGVIAFYIKDWEDSESESNCQFISSDRLFIFKTYCLL